MPPHVHKICKLKIFQFYILAFIHFNHQLLLEYHSYQLWQFLIPFQSLYCREKEAEQTWDTDGWDSVAGAVLRGQT